MRTMITVAAALFACVSAGAAADFPERARIDCAIVVDGGRNTVSFGVENLGSLSARLLPLPGTPAGKPVIQGEENRAIRSMNDDGGHLRAAGSTIQLFSDPAGSNVKIFLTISSGYTRGWASGFGDESDSWYTKDVSCSVSDMGAPAAEKGYSCFGYRTESECKKMPVFCKWNSGTRRCESK